MLILSRRPGEAFVIHPAADLHPDTTVRELFEDGPITITLGKIRGKQVSLAIEAPRELGVLRSELVEPDGTYD